MWCERFVSSNKFGWKKSLFNDFTGQYLCEWFLIKFFLQVALNMERRYTFFGDWYSVEYIYLVVSVVKHLLVITTVKFKGSWFKSLLRTLTYLKVTPSRRVDCRKKSGKEFYPESFSFPLHRPPPFIVRNYLWEKHLPAASATLTNDDGDEYYGELT